MRFLALLFVFLSFASPVAAQDRSPDPSWHGQPCRDIGSGFCEAAGGIVYIDVSRYCQKELQNLSKYVDSRIRVWKRLYPYKGVRGSAGWRERTGGTALQPTYTCWWALFYE